MTKKIKAKVWFYKLRGLITGKSYPGLETFERQQILGTLTHFGEFIPQVSLLSLFSSYEHRDIQELGEILDDCAVK